MNLLKANILIVAIFFLVGIFYYSETTVHIIRHGEKVIKSGVSDAPLTNLGRMQARKLGKYLSNQAHISLLYASPMRRARETAEIIASYTNGHIILDDLLVEKNYRKSDKLYPDGNHIYIKFLPGGVKESKNQHLIRVLNFFDHKVSIFNKELYIVAHGGLVKRIFERIAKERNKNLNKSKINYCSVFTFKYNKINKSFRYVNHYRL